MCVPRVHAALCVLDEATPALAGIPMQGAQGARVAAESSVEAPLTGCTLRFCWELGAQAFGEAGPWVDKPPFAISRLCSHQALRAPCENLTSDIGRIFSAG